MKLISNTKFGQLLSQQVLKGCMSYEDYFKMRRNYDELFEQKLELWMFVPCDEEGNILEKPEKYDKNAVYVAIKSTYYKYQKAKERVLFHIPNEYHSDLEIFAKKLCASQKNNIEDLVGSKFELTPTALKQIGITN